MKAPLPDRITLDADLIPVGRAVQAEPGQHLIVVAGLVVGVYTGDRKKALEAPPKGIEGPAERGAEKAPPWDREAPGQTREMAESLHAFLEGSPGQRATSTKALAAVGVRRGSARYEHFKRAVRASVDAGAFEVSGSGPHRVLALRREGAPKALPEAARTSRPVPRTDQPSREQMKARVMELVARNGGTLTGSAAMAALDVKANGVGYSAYRYALIALRDEGKLVATPGAARKDGLAYSLPADPAP